MPSVRACAPYICDLQICLVHQVRPEIASKRVLVFYRPNRVVFDYVIGEIHAKLMSAKVTTTVRRPGGVRVAQSIGEPITQMTLNTFHFAGVSAKTLRWEYLCEGDHQCSEKHQDSIFEHLSAGAGQGGGQTKRTDRKSPRR